MQLPQNIEELSGLLKEVLLLPVNMLLDFDKRVHVIYLLSSVLLALFVYLKTKPKGGFIKYIFAKKIWWSNSAKIDYYIIFFNSLIKVLLFTPLLLLELKFSLFTSDWCYRFLGEGSFIERSWLVFLFYTFALTVVGDFMTFLIHYLMHHVPILWEFHKTHHSAIFLNPFTQFRIHPVELLLNNLFSIFGFGIVTGFFNYMMIGGVDLVTLLGSNIFLVIWRFLGANLRHSHVKLKFPAVLETWFISPYQHQIHHSDNPRFYNKNLGSMLAIWDYLFGSLSRSKEINQIRFGLGAQENKKHDTFFKNTWNPFLRLFALFRKK